MSSNLDVPNIWSLSQKLLHILAPPLPLQKGPSELSEMSCAGLKSSVCPPNFNCGVGEDS